MSLLSGLYGRAAASRRAWYDRHPDRRRRLARPVVSVGNLVTGGSGKTPTVAALARLLQQLGERPAILSRGYARREAPDGVTVVSNGIRVLEPTERSGDEPQMLARALAGVPVLVARDRFLAGRLAERQCGATVHLLDDGFQHLGLAREIDLLIVSADDLDGQMIPSGRLREPLAAARQADALIVPGVEEEARTVAGRLGGGEPFLLSVRYEALRQVGEESAPIRPDSSPAGATANGRAIAVAGIARPERFFAALRAEGWEVVREMRFRDHHRFSARDVAAIERAARDARAEAIVTTEKDAVRLDALVKPGSGWLWLPMRVEIAPADRFAAWLAGRLRAARADRGTAA